MAQLIQDTNITSSLASSKSLQNDDNVLDEKALLHEKEETDIILIHENCNKELRNHKNGEVQNNKLHSTKSFEKVFSWLIRFDKVMQSSIGKRSFHLLEQLLSIYVNNILKFMEINYIMTFEVIKLKKHMNIELRTSKRSKDPSQIAAKLYSTLWIYLNKSKEHIFKVLLRIKLITKRYAKICDLMFSKSFTNLKANGESMTGIKYIRYLFALKLWRKIKENSEETKQVDELAVAILGSHMPKMQAELLNLVPKLPLNCKNETLWLMQPNLFDLKQACNDFLILEEKIEMTEYNELLSTIKTERIHDYTNPGTSINTIKNKEIDSLGCISNINQKITLDESKLMKDICEENDNSGKSHIKKKIRKNKKFKFVPNVKPGEIIVIDFSKDNEECISPKKKKKNKCKRKLGWLRIVAKKCRKNQKLFIDDAKNIDTKEYADTVNKQNRLEDLQSSLTSLIDHDSFCNTLNFNERIINPCLIKKCVEDKTLSDNNERNVELYNQEPLINITDSSALGKKCEQSVNQKNWVGRCVDIVAFGLNAKAEEDFDLFSLDDNGSISMFKNISSSCSSPLRIQSDIKISESTECVSNLDFKNSDCESNDMRMEQVYDFQEADILKENSSKTNTTHQTLMDEACISKDVPSNHLPIQTEDLFVPPYNNIPTSSLQLDFELLPTEQLIETFNSSLPFSQYDLVSNNPIPLDSQSTSTENDNINIQQIVTGLQSVEPYERIQQNIKISSDCNQLYTDKEIMENTNNFWKQVELTDLDDTLPQKKNVTLNFRKPNIIFKNDIETDQSVIMITEGVSEDTNLLYKVESEGNVLIPTEKSCLKPLKGNITKSDTQISKIPLIQDKCMKEISTKISIRPNVRKLDITSFNEETSIKRRKVTSEFLPLLDASRVIYSTNTQTQAKDLLSGMKVNSLTIEIMASSEQRFNKNLFLSILLIRLYLYLKKHLLLLKYFSSSDNIKYIIEEALLSTFKNNYDGINGQNMHMIPPIAVKAYHAAYHVQASITTKEAKNLH
ncbi:hypothetical protein HZH68_002635 [Vespula germanica]|uniref:Uncharacterized protein n=1 Tax=Vespula germanica TaxID=30212 RepID=A0A834U151_VESGE|nr:hypothetical protein HZH68_002635 [Vespula germanica]